MPSRAIIPAAQYLRTSTDLQQHSMENQKTLIQEYATYHGFAVVRTYTAAVRPFYPASPDLLAAFGSWNKEEIQCGMFTPS